MSDHSFLSPSLGDFDPHFSIAGTQIGEGRPCYVIAEAGSNHDRTLDRALSLVDIAADAACHAVKFQTFTGLEIAAGPASGLTKLPAEFARWGSEMAEFYEACSLPRDFYQPLLARAKERGITFLSTPFSEGSVDFLYGLGVPALKIASFEVVHLPLIRHAASTKLPLIISTGTAGLSDIERALEAAAKGGARSVALLHCGSNYPLEIASANLKAMATLRSAFGVPVGYSDHTKGIAVPVAAAAVQANVLEKHFTHHGPWDGPDHGFAVRPDELKTMVSMMREAEAALGSSRKRRQPEEAEHAARGRRSLFAARAIKAGSALDPQDVKVVRPGYGLEPALLDIVLGKRLLRDVHPDEALSWDMFMSVVTKDGR
jgi:sialic acid synthase SpsE